MRALLSKYQLAVWALVFLMVAMCAVTAPVRTLLVFVAGLAGLQLYALRDGALPATSEADKDAEPSTYPGEETLELPHNTQNTHSLSEQPAVDDTLLPELPGGP